ncbi:XRE family transcriptional regulator [Gloeobacter kilaueensis]|nr:XRE family transcriptional regulator [Gloeobacter kilaueensis]
MQSVGIESWRQLARRCGVSARAVQLVRRGEADQLRTRAAQQLAAGLAVDLPTFLGDFGRLDLPRSPRDRDALWAECRRLQQQLDEQKALLTAQFRTQTAGQLLALLVQAPTLREAALKNPALKAASFVHLLAPLESLMADWGYRTIGAVWQPVSFDPDLHQPDSEKIVPGEAVYVRFVGYRSDDGAVLCKAKVSRTLPGGSP